MIHSNFKKVKGAGWGMGERRGVREAVRGPCPQLAVRFACLCHCQAAGASTRGGPGHGGTVETHREEQQLRQAGEREERRAGVTMGRRRSLIT